MKPKLLYVINDAGFFLSHRLALARAAEKSGFEIHVAVPAGPKSGDIAAKGFTVHLIPMSRTGVNPLAEARSVLALYSLYRKLKPDLVHQLTIKPMIYGSIAAALSGTGPVVNAVTGMGYAFTERGLFNAMLRAIVMAAYRLAFGFIRHRIIFQNPDDRDFFLENDLVSEREAAVIRGSGVDPEEFPYTPEPEGTPVVVLASRMLWNKGIGDFVEAARRLKSEGLRARFALVGTSDPANPSSVPESELKRWNEEGCVEWWGLRKDMPAVLSGASVVCLPSYYREGVPRVLIEAACAGRPIVTTNTPGCREIAQNGDNGLLVPPRDGGALAQALKTLILAPEIRKRMGRKGRSLVESDFSLQRVIRDTLEVYDMLLPQRSHSL